MLESSFSLVIVSLGALAFIIGAIAGLLNQFYFWEHRKQMDSQEVAAGAFFSLLPMAFPRFEDAELQRVATFRANLFLTCVPLGILSILLTLIFEGGYDSST